MKPDHTYSPVASATRKAALSVQDEIAAAELSPCPKFRASLGTIPARGEKNVHNPTAPGFTSGLILSDISHPSNGAFFSAATALLLLDDILKCLMRD